MGFWLVNVVWQDDDELMSLDIPGNLVYSKEMLNSLRPQYLKTSLYSFI